MLAALKLNRAISQKGKLAATVISRGGVPQTARIWLLPDPAIKHIHREIEVFRS
jgi:hypothetical protein